jgi:signal transduction histidine kinase/ligand-binding sensor domain-containing protein
MNKHYSILLLIVIALNTNPSTAQLDPHKVTHFPELDGTLIHDIISDRKGVIWIATQSGLVKFDGYDYKRYYPDENDSLTIGTILTSQLYEDNEGNIWIGCMDEIYKHNPVTGSFKRYNYTSLVGYPEWGQPIVNTIYGDFEGRIYFGIVSFNNVDGKNALVYYDNEEDTMKSFEKPDNLELGSVYWLAPVPSGDLWVLSGRNVYKIDSNQNMDIVPEFNESEAYNIINGVKSNTEGSIWITTAEAALLLYNPTTKKVSSWSMSHLFNEDQPHYYIMDIQIDKHQNLWIPSRQGLIRFDLASEQFEMFRDGNADRILSNHINCLHLDNFENLWIGLQSAGMLKFKDRATMHSIVHHINNEKGLTGGWVLKMLDGTDGKIWLSTYRGLCSFDPVTGMLDSYQATSIASGIYSVSLLKELLPGKLLLESNEGIGIFDTKSHSYKPVTLEYLPDSININVIKTDRFGTEWYGTTGGLFALHNKNEEIQYFDLSNMKGSNMASNHVSNIWESHKYGLWITTNNGLYLYDFGTEQIEKHGYDPDKGDVLSAQDINSIYESTDGIVWIGTWLGGLCRYNPETGEIKTYSIYDGLPSKSIQGILGDENNNALWLSTFAGISRFSKNEEEFTNYSLDDGIQGLLHADGSYLKTKGGLLFFGGNNGFTYFDPNEIVKQSIEPQVYITEFKAENERVDIPSDVKQGDKYLIELPHNQNNISFNYTGIHYDNPQNNSFRYYLENYDDSWRDVGNLRSAFYYNLPSGEYTFRVLAANSNSIWNEEGASISFVINPPWWKTLWAYGAYVILFVTGVVAVDRIQKRRILEKQRRMAREKELKHAREIKKAYNKLKTTQSQLIHAEKMASLGELTAGIAHEIQNPLNFVNNFSEVNLELMSELKEEIKKGDMEEANALADDIAQNEEKVNYHGKRADSIVKGMLQHSRSSQSEKVPTDLNALADEYLRLSFHGLRAKNKSFNADFRIEADENLPRVNVIPQEIGRVLLNLINNAFYAVSTKASEKGDKNYRPEVIVSTGIIPPLKGDKARPDGPSGQGGIEISVKDNGDGVPEDIKEKIFQPFFSTKPTGEGTGLGLSMSYDIITKGHGGDLKMETHEGKGTTFIIQLPII